MVSGKIWIFWGVLAAVATRGWAADIGIRPADAIGWTEKQREAEKAVFETSSVKTFLASTAGNHLTVEARVADAELETIKFQHYFNGIEVLGSMSFHHRGATETLVRDELARFDLDTVPTVSKEEAASVAHGVTGGERNLSGLPELKILPSDEQPSARLVYWVGISQSATEAGRDVLLDAHSGEVLADISRFLEVAAPVQVYDARIQMIQIPQPEKLTGWWKILSPMQPGKYSGLREQCQVIHPESGMPLVLNPRVCGHVIAAGQAGPHADDSAKRAAANSLRVLKYFEEQHGRSSYDGKGSEVVSVVHVGRGFTNAFWSMDGNYMAYGDGDGLEFADLTTAVDVAGHEMTHGVIDSSVKLLNMGEAGAVNEAFADFFGKVIADDGSWVMGRGLLLRQGQHAGLRDLARPGNLSFSMEDASGISREVPYPAHMRDKLPNEGLCNRSNDNCWVHINATIPGHASYLVAKAIGKMKAQKLFYAVITQYLPRGRVNFRTVSAAAQAACTQLFSRADCAKVKASYQQVGL